MSSVLFLSFNLQCKCYEVLCVSKEGEGEAGKLVSTEHFLCIRPCTESFTYISSFHPHTPSEVNIIIAVLKMRKLRFREIEQFSETK